MVLDGLPGLYGLKYDSVTACGLPLYLCSYKLDGSATTRISCKFCVTIELLTEFRLSILAWPVSTSVDLPEVIILI